MRQNSEVFVHPDAMDDAGEAISHLLDAAPDGAIIRFAPGRYRFRTPARLRGKRCITLDGGGAELLQYARGGSFADGILWVDDCENITLRGFVIRTDGAVGLTGRVTAAGDGTLDILPDPGTVIDPAQPFLHGYTFHDEGYPTYRTVTAAAKGSERAMVGGVIPTTNPISPPIPWKLTEDGILRLTGCRHSIAPGTRIALRSVIYGPAAFRFVNAARVRIEDVSIRAFGGMGFVILPRCFDFTFERVRFLPEEGALFSSNADGIHTTGLGGTLSIRGCEFVSLGDDALNVHTQVLAVKTLRGNAFVVKFDKPLGSISPDYARPGDILRAFDPATLARRRELTVTGFGGGVITVADAGDLCEGDLLVNTAYHPDVRIEACTSAAMRDRAFVVQGAASVGMTGCTFRQVTGSGLYLSSAFQTWLEGGGTENVRIEGNRFIGCSCWGTNPYAAVHAWVRGELSAPPVLHRGITVENNRFEQLHHGRAVFIRASEAVTLSGNAFEGCMEPHISIE